MPRLDAQILTREERIAAQRIHELGQEIMTTCYYGECQGIPPATVRALHKTYRVLKAAVLFYFEDHYCGWDPPDFKFRAKGAK